MKIKSIEFLQSVADWRKSPPQNFPEYAFIGRSNVGKSSLINMIANNSSLAKISSRPGKTQTINHFLVNKDWFLVDLPGYGYASISKTMREKWEKMIRNYFLNRQNLQLVFVLIDSRLEPQKKDIEFINQLGEISMSFALIFTKTDKISDLRASQNMQQFKQKLLETWEDLPPIFKSSTVNKKGKEEILDYIQKINATFYENLEN